VRDYGIDIASGNVSAPQRKADKTPAAATPWTPRTRLELTADLVRVVELAAVVAALAALVAAHGQEHYLQANPGDRAAPNRLACRACPV